MTELSAQQQADLAKLHKEIADQDQLMIHGVFLLAFLMIGVFTAAEVALNVVLFKLVFALAVTTTFWVARGDYMIHRAAAYVETIETNDGTQKGGWEAYKAGLNSPKLMLLIDVFAAIGLFWMLYETSSKLVLFGEASWVFLGWSGVVLGVAFTGLLVKLAHKHW